MDSLTRSDKIIPITDHPIYGSMLSEVLKLFLAGKSGEILAFLIQYIKTHYIDKIFPPGPVPPVAQSSQAGAETAFRALIQHAVEDHGPSRKATVGAAINVSTVIDYIINILKGVVADYLPTIELQIVNYGLSVVVPALEAQGPSMVMVAGVVKIILTKIKEGLETHQAKAA